MKMLLLNLRRDIRRTLGQFVSILLVVAVGCFFFAGMTEASSGIERQMQDFYRTQNFADSTGYFMYVNSLAVDEIRQSEGVTYAEGRNTFYTDTTLGGSSYDLVVSTLTEHVNLPYLRDGELPRSGQCLVDYIFADAHGLKTGDRITFDVDTLRRLNLTFVEGKDPIQTLHTETQTVTLEISGLYHSPELVYKVNVRDVAAKGTEFGILLVNYDELPLFATGAAVSANDDPNFTVPIDTTLDIFTEVVTDANIHTEALFQKYTIKTVDELMEIYKHQSDRAAGLYMYTVQQENHPSETAFRATFDQLKNLISIVPMIFFAVAAAITFISLSKTVDNQRTQIGIMQALGIYKSSIYFTYLLYAAFAALAGAIIGGFAGVYSIPFLYAFVFSEQYNMPMTALSIHPWLVFAGIAVALVVALLSAYTSCRKTLKEIPAAALRPKPPKKTKKILLERWNWFWRKTGFGAKIILRNIFLHKGRILLSSVGVVGCLTLLLGGIGLKDRVSFILTHFEKSAGFDLQLTLAENSDITQIDFDRLLQEDTLGNIKYLTFTPKLNGKVTLNEYSRDMPIIALPSEISKERFPLSTQNCKLLYRDYDSSDRLRFAADTFAIPHKLAEDLKISVGDKVEINAYTAENQNVTVAVTITDIVKQYADQSIYASYEIFEQCGFGLYANALFVNVLDASRLQESKQSLLLNSAVANAYTAEEIQANIINGISVLDAVVGLIVIGAAVLAVAVIYNITAINVFERTRELATLMVLGYKKHETNRLVFVENMVITFIGCILGIPIGYGFLSWLAVIVNSMNVCIPGNLTPIVALLCVGLTFVFSIIATLLLSRKMQKISMVESLKSVE